MLLNEVIKQVDLSKRAIKFYEEKGLLDVPKNANGYRNYTDEHVRILKEISAYRKLGISLSDIRVLLKDRDKTALARIYEEKKREWKNFSLHTIRISCMPPSIIPPSPRPFRTCFPVFTVIFSCSIFFPISKSLWKRRHRRKRTMPSLPSGTMHPSGFCASVPGFSIA